jgi:hypothetical protein
VRRTPGIPTDLFFGDSSSGAAEAPPAAPAPVRPVEEAKVQVTVYLSEAVAKRLEALRFHLLNEYDVKVSKSALAEHAIRHLGEDLEQLAQQLRMGER